MLDLTRFETDLFNTDDTDCYQGFLSEPFSLSVTCNEPARLLLLRSVWGAVRGRFTSHLKQQYDSMITRVTTKTHS